MDVGKNPVGGIDVVFRDVFPNLVEICERIRMKGLVARLRPTTWEGQEPAALRSSVVAASGSPRSRSIRAENE
jgi:hypothetical protein